MKYAQKTGNSIIRALKRKMCEPTRRKEHSKRKWVNSLSQNGLFRSSQLKYSRASPVTMIFLWPESMQKSREKKKVANKCMQCQLKWDDDLSPHSFLYYSHTHSHIQTNSHKSTLYARTHARSHAQTHTPTRQATVERNHTENGS